MDLLRNTALLLIIFSALFVPPSARADTGPYRLVGTIEGGQGFTGAVLDDSSGTQTFYRMSEALPDGSRIVKITSDTVAIKRSDGSTYNLFLLQTTKPGVVTARPAASPAMNPNPAPVPAQDAVPAQPARPAPAPQAQQQAQPASPPPGQIDQRTRGMQGAGQAPGARARARERRSARGAGAEE